jgi:hypothetical protein
VPEAAQTGSLQGVFTGYFAHLPVPSQFPVVPQTDDPSSLHWFLGSFTPWATGRQVPAKPVELQVTQAPTQVSLQQTPSTQNPLVHWIPLVQTDPSCFRPQLLLMQTLPGMHWVSRSQDDRHFGGTLALVQLKGAQEKGASTEHFPFPSHVPVPLMIEPAQLPDMQIVPL